MKLIFTRQSLIEFGAIRSYLASHGIDTFLRNEFSSGGMGEVPFSEAWPQLWASEQLVDKALQLIDTLENKTNSKSDWVCKTCDEENPDTFDFCWNCSSER